MRAGRSTTVVHIAGFRGTTTTTPVCTGAWKRSGGVTSQVHGPRARPGHFASPNTSVLPACEVWPSGDVQRTRAPMIGSFFSSWRWTTSGPGMRKRSARMAMTPAITQTTTTASIFAASR